MQEFITTRQGYRTATSTGRVLTGRGAVFILIDDPLKPDEAVSDVQRKATNEWYSNALYSRLNDKRSGAIVIIMQRLHEDDLVGHVLAQEPWELVCSPAIAEAERCTRSRRSGGPRCFTRRQSEALHPAREALDTLERIRRTIGEYNFAGPSVPGTRRNVPNAAIALSMPRTVSLRAASRASGAALALGRAGQRRARPART